MSGALLTQTIVAGLLFGVTPTEPLILGAVALSLVLTSAMAAALPAQRAARVDPALALAGD